MNWREALYFVLVVFGVTSGILAIASPNPIVSSVLAITSIIGILGAAGLWIEYGNRNQENRFEKERQERQRLLEAQRKTEEEERRREAEVEAQRRKQLEWAKNLETSGRYEEAAKVFDTLSMYEDAGECRRMARTSYQISTNFSLGKDGAISVRCPNCGSTHNMVSKANLVVCEHCGNSYTVPKRILDMM
jgi:hypothetical protein